MTSTVEKATALCFAILIPVTLHAQPQDCAGQALAIQLNRNLPIDDAISHALADCWHTYEKQVDTYQQQLLQLGIKPSAHTQAMAWAYTTQASLRHLNTMVNN